MNSGINASRGIKPDRRLVIQSYLVCHYNNPIGRVIIEDDGQYSYEPSAEKLAAKLGMTVDEFLAWVKGLLDGVHKRDGQQE